MNKIKNNFELTFDIEENDLGLYRASYFYTRRGSQSGWHPSPWAAIAKIVTDVVLSETLPPTKLVFRPGPPTEPGNYLVKSPDDREKWWVNHIVVTKRDLEVAKEHPVYLAGLWCRIVIEVEDE